MFDVKQPLNYQASADLLKNKTILVTGASDGIGRAVALAYAKHGATVILHGRSVEKLEAVYDQIIQQGSAKPAIVPLDLAKASLPQYQELAQVIESDLGKLDGILHNAGIISELSPIEYTDAAIWHEMMQVNINSVFMLTQSCLLLLKQSSAASIITTSSGVARKGRAFWGPYSVSKFAIEGFTQILADELEKTCVRINAINPGATRTKMRAIPYPAEDVSKLMTPDDLVPLYLYLMGNDSLDVNGQSIDAQPK
ncbi:MAG: YciK family oxidoreductase [Enterobacterales bacterium]|nr:YciK family oxidoreductase [Enterobacterales bacterium]